MYVQIEIKNSTIKRLQKFAQPLTDTYDSTINGLIDKIEKKTVIPIRNVKKRTKTSTPSRRLWLVQIPELRNIKGLNTWKDICNYLGLDSKGDSARRVLKKWTAINKPEWTEIPEPK